MTADAKKRGGVVDSAVFRVESDGRIFWVMEDRTSSNEYRFVCTCPARYDCEHIEAVKAHIAGYAAADSPRGRRAGYPDRDLISRDSFPSLPPAPGRQKPAPLSAVAARTKETSALYGNPEKVREVRDRLGRALAGIVSESVEENRSKLKSMTDDMVEALRDVRATDLLKSVAALRRALLDENLDPVAIATGIERTARASEILGRYVQEATVDERLQTTFLGRVWEIDEVDLQEETHLMEIARNSVLTPFGTRRSESYYMNITSGDLFIEEKYHAPGGGNPSVGPFPKLIHVHLMTVEPRPQPRSVNLLQYSVMPPPNEGDLVKIKTMAIDTVEAALEFYGRVVEVVQAPYPVFVAFSPLNTEIYKGRLIMRDKEDDVIGLAYSSSPYGCLAVEKICSESHLHATSGLLVREGGHLALNPLSLLVEDGTGLKMMRIK